MYLWWIDDICVIIKAYRMHCLKRLIHYSLSVIPCNANTWLVWGKKWVSHNPGLKHLDQSWKKLLSELSWICTLFLSYTVLKLQGGLNRICASSWLKLFSIRSAAAAFTLCSVAVPEVGGSNLRTGGAVGRLSTPSSFCRFCYDHELQFCCSWGWYFCFKNGTFIFPYNNQWGYSMTHEQGQRPSRPAVKTERAVLM